jgi:hypothetical protein
MLELSEKKIGQITIGTDIELDHEFYLVPVEDKNIKVRGIAITYNLPVHRELVEQEFYMRGKSRMVQSFWSGSDEEDERMHELTFAEFEEYTEYRRELDAFVMEIAADVLHAQDLADARELNVKYFAQLNQERKVYEDKIKDLESKLYQAMNPNIKKAS